MRWSVSVNPLQTAYSTDIVGWNMRGKSQPNSRRCISATKNVEVKLVIFSDSQLFDQLCLHH